MTRAMYRRDLINRFVGTEVIWHDENNYSVGPGTVVGLTKDSKLRIIEHQTLMYVNKWAIIDQVEVIKFSDEQYEALPQILRDEIRNATSQGDQCGTDDCTDRRVFGGEFCAEHEVMFFESENDPREDLFWDEATA
jgi:hypothetical protein